MNKIHNNILFLVKIVHNLSVDQSEILKMQLLCVLTFFVTLAIVLAKQVKPHRQVVNALNQTYTPMGARMAQQMDPG